jgi:hypothetical protein
MNAQILAIVALTSALISGLGGWLVRGNIADRDVAKLQATHAQERKQFSDAARLAEAKARATEQRRVTDLEAIQNEANKRTAALQADVVSARAAADSLRKHVARIAAARGGPASDSAASASSQTTAETGSLLSDVFVESIDRVVELAAYADAARAAGLACEQAYEAVRGDP